jgi:hypothetical protein
LNFRVGVSMFWVPIHYAGGLNLEKLLAVKIKWPHLVDSTSIVICFAAEFQITAYANSVIQQI